MSMKSFSSYSLQTKMTAVELILITAGCQTILISHMHHVAHLHKSYLVPVTSCHHSTTPWNYQLHCCRVQTLSL